MLEKYRHKGFEIGNFTEYFLTSNNSDGSAHLNPKDIIMGSVKSPPFQLGRSFCIQGIGKFPRVLGTFNEILQRDTISHKNLKKASFYSQKPIFYELGGPRF